MNTHHDWWVFFIKINLDKKNSLRTIIGLTILIWEYDKMKKTKSKEMTKFMWYISLPIILDWLFYQLILLLIIFFQK
jgi:hypothetical protein